MRACDVAAWFCTMIIVWVAAAIVLGSGPAAASVVFAFRQTSAMPAGLGLEVSGWIAFSDQALQAGVRYTADIDDPLPPQWSANGVEGFHFETNNLTGFASMKMEELKLRNDYVMQFMYWGY